LIDSHPMRYTQALRVCPRRHDGCHLKGEDSTYTPCPKIGVHFITLNRMSARDRKNWAAKVIFQLQEHNDLGNDHFVILAGQKYRQYLLPRLKFYEVPLAGLPVGIQLQFLKEKTARE